MTDSDSATDGVYPLPDIESSNSSDTFHHVFPPLYDAPANPANSTCFIKFKFVVQREPDLTNHMDRIPNEILLYILEYLPRKDLARVAQTCTRLNRLAYHQKFWRCIDLCCRKQINTNVIGYVLSRGAKYLTMQVSRVASPLLDFPMYKTLASQRIDLSHLDISYAMIPTIDMNALFTFLTNLEVLLMEEQRIDGTTCLLIAQNLKLSTLGMAMVVGLTPSGLRCIVKNCKSLQFLNLSWATKFDGVEYDQMVKDINCNLLEISLAGSLGLRNSHLETLMSRCLRLRKIDVSDSMLLKPLTDAQFLLLQKLPLVGLYTSRTRLLDGLKDRWFDKLALLKELDVVTLHLIFKKYPSVAYLKAYDCGIARALHNIRSQHPFFHGQLKSLYC